MTVLSFGATATIGSLRYTGGIAGVRITMPIGPAVGSARVSVPRDLRVEAKPGDDVEIALIGESGEETTAFTGTVSAVRRTLDQTVLLCGDASAALAAIRPGSTFEQQGGSAIVGALARDAGVGTGAIDLDLDLACYVADQGRTAWEHLTALAAWGGAFVAASADGNVEVRKFPSPPAETALRYGREIAELSVGTVAPAAEVVSIGNGSAGNGSDPRARLQSTETLPADAPKPGPRTIRVAAAALRTPAVAATATNAVVGRNGAPRLSATCWLVPTLRAGTSVEIADAPTADAAGPWLLTRVVHSVGPGPAGCTTFEGVGMEAAGGSGLLDMVMGAVGSLL